MFVDLSVFNYTGHGTLLGFAYVVINLAISLSVLVVVVSLIISGFKYILSMGDEEKIKSATKSLTFSLLGLVIVFLSPRIIEFIIEQLLQS
jgi:uncharacterized membrane protein